MCNKIMDDLQLPIDPISKNIMKNNVENAMIFTLMMY